jgi:hypothetical protein
MDRIRSLSLAALLGMIAAGCTGAAGKAPPAELSGSLSMSLTLDGAVTLDSVNYVVFASTGTVLASGTTDVRDSLVLQTVVTLPAGTNETATFTGTSVDGRVTCSGTSAPFTVVPHARISVPVDLLCRPRGLDSGLVSFMGSLTSCATIQSIDVNPSETTVGGVVTLDATASGVDPAALTYAWSAPSGSFGSPGASSTTFTCTTPGTVLVTLAVGDGATGDGGVPCGDTEGFTVQCDASDAGGAGCGNIQSDPDNCGGCGHSCQGGACSAGVCQPLVLATGVCPTSIAVDDTNVYFTHDVSAGWSVQRVAKTGGPVATLASETTSTNEIWADSVGVFQGLVYFVRLQAGGDQTLQSVPASGGTVTLVSHPGVGGSIRQPTRAVVSNATGLYWANEESGITRVDPSNNVTFIVSPDALVSFGPDAGSVSLVYPVTLAVDSSHVYFTSNSNPPLEFLASSPLAGGAIQTIAQIPFPFTTGQLSLADAAIVSNGTDVYWATLQAPGGLFRVPVQPAGPQTLFAQSFANGATVTSLAVDATHLYWTEHDASGTIGAASLDTAVLTRVAVGQSYPFAIATDETSVYWANAGVDVTNLAGNSSPATCAGSIVKLAK